MLDVLIVDDSAAIRKILQRVLRPAEVPLGQVFEAGDGAEAIEMLKRQPVGLVLSDINMPNMDGFEFLTKVRADQAWEKLPIVTVRTAQAKVMDTVECGTSGYVRKPFTAEPIKEKLSVFSKANERCHDREDRASQRGHTGRVGSRKPSIGRDFRFHILLNVYRRKPIGTTGHSNQGENDGNSSNRSSESG